MRLNPIRRSQLVAPFGPGALHVLEGGIAVVTGGLDDWFRDKLGNPASPEALKGTLLVREPRLEGPLRVSHFRLAPGPENRGSSDEPELVTPVFRFPTWYFCPGCYAMRKGRLTQWGYRTCDNPKCKKRRLRQLSFAAVCDHGHLQDFPWLEWVHRGAAYGDACGRSLRYMAGGSGSLESIKIKCESCGSGRSLAGVMSGEFPSKPGERGWSGLSRNLRRSGKESDADAEVEEFTCQGHKPWQGDVRADSCSRPLRAVLINSTNVHYADVRSAIHIPARYKPSASSLLAILDEPDFRARIEIRRRLDDDLEDILKSVKKLDLGFDPPRLTSFSDEQILAALKGHDAAPPSSDTSDEAVSAMSRGEQEARIRREEFEAFLGQTDREGRLVLRAVDKAGLPSPFDGLVDRIVAIEKLKETRVFAGFSRLLGNPPVGAPRPEQLLWRSYPQDPANRWLPAAESFGEGIFLTLNEDKIQEWEERDDVRMHLDVLQENYDSCVERYGWEDRVISPRLVLVHTLAHLLINRLVFECGYGSASLRERLYVSTEHGEQMAGLLIYTAAGDSEGTMGGLVSLSEAESLGRVLTNALDEAAWCSADPVCGEAAKSGGQGPDSLNLAACHSCALLPETSCEHFNKFLDRSLLVDPSISVFGQSH